MYKVAGIERPEPQGAPGGRAGRGGAGGGRGAAPDRLVALTDSDTAWQAALSYSPNWRALTLQIPRDADSDLRVTLDEGSARQVQQQTVLTIDRAGTIAKAEAFADRAPAQRLRSWARFGHTGEAWGVVGQTIAGLGCLGGVFLFYTGVALSFRRFLAWRTRRRLARWGAVPEDLAAAPAEA
jgi:uncharacterized iron-regulated membrane protein